MRIIKRILGVDIGTTSLKMGIYEIKEDSSIVLIQTYSESYPLNPQKDTSFSDIDSEYWKRAFIHGCEAMKDNLSIVRAIGLSGSTPGFTPLDSHGEALSPSILMFDQRSRKQAQQIIDKVGEENILQRTGNLPVAGGCSLASLLWIREMYPEIDKNTVCYGHSNTVVGAWLTGEFGIDPSSASLFGLNNANTGNMEWDAELLEVFEIDENKLPKIIRSFDSIGTVKHELAELLGFEVPPAVVIGGNDAAVAMFSLDDLQVGDVININGTCEISSVLLEKFMPSKNYNIRSQIIPGQWLTLYVMNAGGKAYEWFRDVFCSEMSYRTFFDNFVPSALKSYATKQSSVEYIPFLMGSRYSLAELKAGFVNLTQDTTREEMLVAMVRSLCSYQRNHLDELDQKVLLSNKIYITGGAVNEAIIEAKSKWYRAADYCFTEQSSMKGAAKLAAKYEEANSH